MARLSFKKLCRSNRVNHEDAVSMFRMLRQSMVVGDRLEIENLGVFYKVIQPARSMSRLGVVTNLPARPVIKFRPPRRRGISLAYYFTLEAIWRPDQFNQSAPRSIVDGASGEVVSSTVSPGFLSGLVLKLNSAGNGVINVYGRRQTDTYLHEIEQTFQINLGAGQQTISTTVIVDNNEVPNLTDAFGAPSFGSFGKVTITEGSAAPREIAFGDPNILNEDEELITLIRGAVDSFDDTHLYGG